MPQVEGRVESGFEAVAEAFEANFATRGEHGAAFAATLDGEPVVDLWGGFADADAGESWRRDTLHVAFSGTKGLTALCMAMLVDRGLLDLDDRVAAHWPEFGANGKAEITVAEVLSHRARIPGIHTPIQRQDWLDQERMATILAAQAPETDPRARFVYHALTYGWICSELMRRIDGRSIGGFFAEEVAAPLGLEIWIGLPPDLEPRVADLVLAPDWEEMPVGEDDPFAGDELLASICANPLLFERDDLFWATPACHQGELAGSNGIGTARSFARFYGALARGGEIDGVRLLSAETLGRFTQPLASGRDPFSEETEQIYGAGFRLQAGELYGPVREAFGHPGAGGVQYAAWPETKIGFAYGSNEMRDEPGGDPRAAALLQALSGSVASLLAR
ncbi:MAG TPA: serine hydrolase domain-containing protein [Solirubrobacterales bacterium]|nr:serine hydrolase domain-containing protein [Solirubrobacterales bacterium]